MRLQVGGRDFLMREVFEEFRVMPPGSLQVLADAERDKVSRAARNFVALSCMMTRRLTHRLSGCR